MSILYRGKKKREGFLVFCLKSESAWFLSHTQPCRCDFPLSCGYSDELNTNMGALFAIPRLRRSQPHGWNMHLDALSGVPGPICVCASCRQLCSMRLNWDSFQLRYLGTRSYCHYLSNASTVLWTLTQNRALCSSHMAEKMIMWFYGLAYQTPVVLVQKELLRNTGF